MTTIQAHFDGKAFIPDETVDLPKGFAVTVHIEATRSPQESLTTEKRLQQLAVLEKMARKANAPEAHCSG